MIRIYVKRHQVVTTVLLSHTISLNRYSKANVVFVVLCALREYQCVKGHNNVTGLLRHYYFTVQVFTMLWTYNRIISSYV